MGSIARRPAPRKNPRRRGSGQQSRGARPSGPEPRLGAPGGAHSGLAENPLNGRFTQCNGGGIGSAPLCIRIARCSVRTGHIHGTVEIRAFRDSDPGSRYVTAHLGARRNQHLDRGPQIGLDGVLKDVVRIQVPAN